MIKCAEAARWTRAVWAVAAVLVCATAGAWAAPEKPLRVVASFYPVYVAALNVARGVDGVEVENLATPRLGCLHDYRLTAGDMRRLADADIFLVNGAGMETFLDKAAGQLPGLRVVEVSRGIPLMDGNAHVWVSFDGARGQVDNIAAALSEAVPDKAAAFRANARDYKQRLDLLEEKMHAALAPFAGVPIVTFHEAFPYFARDFHLDLAGVIEREPGSEPGARELADIVKLIRSRRVKALFTEPQFPGRSARIVEAETGVKVFELDPVVTGPAEPEAARDAWLAAMENNLAVLQAALK